MMPKADGAPTKNLVVTISIALLLSLVESELLGVNRFLRTTIQGRSFWHYLALLLAWFGLILGYSLRGTDVFHRSSLIKVLSGGAILGLIGSIITLSLLPIIFTGSISPTIGAWKEPIHLFVAGLLACGWVYGILAGFIAYSIVRNQYSRIGVSILICTAAKLLGMLPLHRLIRS